MGGLWLVERALAALLPFPFEAFDRAGSSIVVRAADGTPLRVTANARGERSLPIELDGGRSVAAVAPHLVHALLAAEDRRFFDHGGVDWLAALRAALDNVAHARVVSGASTLTLQLARIAEPRPRTLLSKVIEAFRARQLERSWDKQRILREYVNQVPIGPVRGFEAAAWRWFGKTCSGLTAVEAATLVAMLPAPSRLTPRKSAGELLARRDHVLLEMEAEKSDTFAPLTAIEHPWPFAAPWFCDAMIAAAGVRGGELPTTLDRALQQRVEAALAQSDDAGADGVGVVVVRRNGAVVALVGGRSWAASKVNGALQRRDAGSTLKPFLYALALAEGAIGPDDRLRDAPTLFCDWAPQNFDGRFAGELRFADALVQSRNVPAVRLLDRVGTARFAQLLGAVGLDPGARALDLSAALGTIAVSPLELARAYARFADPGAEIGIAASVRAEVLGLLASFSPLPGLPEGRGIAWKTGTSSARRDAWCVAVTSDYVVVTWRGNLAGPGGADVVGLHAAAPLCARVVAGL